MAKILITGMTSPQSSQRLNSKTMSFAGAIEKILTAAGHTVDWQNLRIDMSEKDVKDYDVVLLGVAPILSVTSNRAYGVLNMLDVLWNHDRLKVFIDTPTPSSISANLRAVSRDSSRLFSEFFYARKQYEAVMLDNHAKFRVLSAAERMSWDKWPKILYPTTPWTDVSLTASKMPVGARDQVTPLCVDSHFIGRVKPVPSRIPTNTWVVDTKSTKWAQSTISSLRFPHRLMKDRRGADDKIVEDSISASFGALISPNSDGTIPWNSHWVQAMNVGTPIASDWKVTSKIGKSWAYLAAGIEEMSMVDRYETSLFQMIDYENAIPSQEEVLQTLQTTLGIHNESTV